MSKKQDFARVRKFLMRGQMWRSRNSLGWILAHREFLTPKELSILEEADKWLSAFAGSYTTNTKLLERRL